jgi:hypothetical protein
MANPTLEQIQDGGYTSVRKTTSRSRSSRDEDRDIEIFRRDSDGTFWWVNSCHGADVTILQVEEITRLTRERNEDGSRKTETVYRQLEG